MAQRIEDKTILVLSRSEFLALNSMLYAIRGNPEGVAALNQVKEADFCLGANEQTVLADMWFSIHEG
jgi:hypothetical protein